MKLCAYCDREIMFDEEREQTPWQEHKWIDTCSGILTLGIDPFAEEIYGDSREFLNCDGGRIDSAMEI